MVSVFVAKPSASLTIVSSAIEIFTARHCDLEANRHNLYDERKHDCYTICEQPSHFHKLNGRTTQILSFPTIKL